MLSPACQAGLGQRFQTTPLRHFNMATTISPVVYLPVKTESSLCAALLKIDTMGSEPPFAANTTKVLFWSLGHIGAMTGSNVGTL
jgi:hypothetical protein